MLQLKRSLNTASLRLPLKAALAATAELPFEAVEIDGRSELPADLSKTGIRQIQKLLEDYRLRLAALTFQTRRPLGDLTDLQQRIDAVKNALRLAYQLGTSTVVCDIGPIPAVEQGVDRDRWRDVLNDLGRTSQREGAFLAARTGTASPDALADFKAELEPGCLLIDLDPARLLLHEHEVETALTRLSDDVIHLHAIDAVRDFAARRAVEVEMGRGSVDWASVFAHLEQANFAGYVTVGRQQSTQPIVEAQQAAEYLQNLFV